MIVYKATNKVNGFIYIGQTSLTLECRVKQHIRDSFRDYTKTPKRKPTLFNEVIKEFGVENFKFEEIEYCATKQQSDERETYWIAYYQSTDRHFGYNLDSGGTYCKKSQSTKNKISATSKEKWKKDEIAQKMMYGLKKGRDTITANAEEFFIDFTCPICGKVIKIKPWEAKNKKTCSSQCGGKTEMQLQHLKELGRTKHKNNYKYKKETIQPIIEQWCLKNQYLILNCPYNKIKTNLKPMLDMVEVKFNIKDIRTLYTCFDVKGSKEFLNKLKELINAQNTLK